MYSEILILAMLQDKPRHGYEIKKAIDIVLRGAVAMNNKVLYPTLKRFEEMGAVGREVVQQEGKPDRHIYRLTEQGVELLHSYLCEFTPEQAASHAEFLTRAAFFDYLTPEERLKILETRMAYIKKHLDHTSVLKGMADSHRASAHAQRVLAFHTQSIENEYYWLSSWIEEIRANQ
jgi:DNA-binding PadR family transcriptional regulator